MIKYDLHEAVNHAFPAVSYTYTHLLRPFLLYCKTKSEEGSPLGPEVPWGFMSNLRDDIIVNVMAFKGASSG